MRFSSLPLSILSRNQVPPCLGRPKSEGPHFCPSSCRATVPFHTSLLVYFRQHPGYDAPRLLWFIFTASLTGLRSLYLPPGVSRKVFLEKVD